MEGAGCSGIITKHSTLSEDCYVFWGGCTVGGEGATDKYREHPSEGNENFGGADLFLLPRSFHWPRYTPVEN